MSQDENMTTMMMAQDDEGENSQEKQQQQQQHRPPNPLENASLYSILFFHWIYPVMKIGFTRPIEENDLPELAKADTSSHNREHLESIWRAEVLAAGAAAAASSSSSMDENGIKRRGRIRKPDLKRAMVVDYIRQTWFFQLGLAINMAGKVGQAVAIGFLVEEFGKVEGEKSYVRCYLYVGVLIGGALSSLFLLHSVNFATWRRGIQLRIACVAAIYSKLLKLPSIGNNSFTTSSSGQIMNLISNDVERFILASVSAPYLFWGPLQCIAVLYIGMRIVGLAFAAGYGLLLFCFIPLQFYLGKKFAFLRSKIAAITDKRVTLVSQTVAGVRVMKMSGWETQFQERIASIRDEEIRSVLRANRSKAWNETISFVANITVSVLIFAVHLWMGEVLTPKIVFTTITLTNISQITMARFFAMAVMTLSECKVSVERIQQFLELPELHKEFSPISDDDDGEGKEAKIEGEINCTTPIMSLNNLTCYWNRTSTPPKITNKTHQQPNNNNNKNISDHSSTDNKKDIVALSNINLNLYKGQLWCIIGPVGSGKSALLQALAGELPPLQNKSISLSTTAKMAYAPQDPWIMDGTIRQNITMGLPFHPTSYSRIIAACALATDIAHQFPQGDGTIVGDRGIQCSGGQRARIGLARALYRAEVENAEVLLLDDPLSAVDSTVGRCIFDEAICDLGVKRGKCVVLATHQHQFVAGEHDDDSGGETSKCVLMEEGKVLCVGSYKTCIEASNGSLVVPTQVVKEEEQPHTLTRGEDQHQQQDFDGGRKIFDNAFQEVKADGDNAADDIKKDFKEDSNVGVVRLQTWLEYGRSMGGIWVGVLMIILFFVTQGTVTLLIALLGKWAHQSPDDQKSSKSLLTIFGLTTFIIFLTTNRALSSFALSVKASQNLHDLMTTSVLRAKIEFFDTNPLGRILNRFSADVGNNDDLLPHTLYDFMVCAVIMLGGVVTAVVVLPMSLVALPPTLWYFIRLRSIFVGTSREVKRLEGKARSPIFAVMGETFGGIATIRANGGEGFYRRKFEEAHDEHTRAAFVFLSTGRWLGVRLDSIVVTLLSVSSILAVLFQQQGWLNVDPSVLGLALTLLVQLAGLFQWGVRQSAEVVNQMVSVERVSAYCHLPSEAPLVVPSVDNATPKNWPATGSISVNDLTVRYRKSLPKALDGITFDIAGGDKVGVVGRTGSGKSTLVQALFRLLEAERGGVSIDGVKISELGLHKLRTAMSVIPQTPILFSGCSIRENLDPFHHHDDDTIWNALRDVQLSNIIKALPDGLHSSVSEAGSNFSVGQRQLICLARAILRQNSILVLDEATANVDSMTEDLLQRAISVRFVGATIIAVAHRLDTVIDFDKILVLGKKGQVLEYGSPKNLLSKDGGHFCLMVKDTGEQMAESLRKKAGAN